MTTTSLHKALQRKVEHFGMRMRPGTAQSPVGDAHLIPRGHGSADCRCRVAGDALAGARGEPVSRAAYILDNHCRTTAIRAGVLGAWSKNPGAGAFPDSGPWLLQCLATIRFVTLHRYPPVRDECAREACTAK